MLNPKEMNFKYCLSTFIFIFFINFGNAQKSAVYTSDFEDYNHALALHKENLYLESQEIFKSIKLNFGANTETRANCEYYIANCAVRLEQQGADDLMLTFVEDYPTSTKQNGAILDVAQFYYSAGKYAKAIKWYGKVGQSSLTSAENETYYFNYGYSLFAVKKSKKAKKYFAKVLDSKKYGSQAKYYYGYMAYSEKDYDTANEYLGQLVSDRSYKNKVAYYLVDMSFKSGDFKKALNLGVPLLEKTRGDEYSQLSKIVGESYFNLEKYEKAIPHLENYRGTNGRWNNTDYYMLGYAYFKLGRHEDAITYFSKIISGRDKVAQNAYYHLALCYLQQDKKMEALNAFRVSSKMSYDLELQQDAYLNYAKLSYEIGNPYKEVAEVLQGYLKKYPETEKTPEIENFIVSAYFNSQNYQGAVDYLEGKKSESNKNHFQKATLFLGIKQFNRGNFSDAIVSFDKSLKYNYNQNIFARSSYWIAESHFRLGHLNKALKYFNQFYDNPASKTTLENKQIYYQKAYVYFAQKEYVAAAADFKKYINSNPSDRLKLNDSYSRLADTYFVSRDYKNAIQIYQKIIKNKASDADYAQFQMAVSQGFLKQDDKKIASLNAFIRNYPKSSFQDDAYFVLADEYIDSNQNSKAIEKYNYLISNFEFSPFVPKAMLKKGVVYYNTNQDEKALKAYKQVVVGFPDTPEAKRAVASARQIYIDLGRVDEYGEWVKTVSFITVSNADLDNDTFESAESLYLKGELQKAAFGFEKYLKSFPEGIHTLKANFYLAESLYLENESAQAIPFYEYVINQANNEFTERSLYKMSVAYLEIEDWSHGIAVLERLELEANDSQNVLYAQSNLMKGYYVQENYEKSVAYADAVLNQSKIDDKIKSDAQIIIARSAFKTNEIEKARSSYKIVEEIATGRLKAEALYFDAYFENADGSYRVSNEIIQKIASDYSSYKYWGGKSLVLMAKNHYELNDAFQASYILESVISRFSKYEDVVEEAKDELRIIKKREAETNDSVKPGY